MKSDGSDAMQFLSREDMLLKAIDRKSSPSQIQTYKYLNLKKHTHTQDSSNVRERR